VVLVAIFDRGTESHLVAPLLLGLASVVAHQGLQRGSARYLALAFAEAMAALHTDFVVPSYLRADDVVWVLVALWALFLLARETAARRLLIRDAPLVAGSFTTMVLAHVLYHDPSSTTGLVAFALMVGLALLTPCGSDRAETADDVAAALLPILAPTWLAFFGNAPILTEGFGGALHTRPLLLTAAAILLTGTGSWLYREHGGASPSTGGPSRLFRRTLAVIDLHASIIRSVCLWLCAAMAVGLQARHYSSAFEKRDFVVFLALYAGLVASWFQEGRLRRSAVGYSLAQLSVVAFFLLVRRQLILTIGLWTPEHDVWLSLLVSLGLTGAKPWMDRQPREARLPSTVSLLALPAAALVWTFMNHLGSDTALLVVGLHSVMFGFLGREEEDSPYKLVAVAGFVAFVLIAFWTKLGLRVLPAYVIPVGIGILALVQIFGGNMVPGTRNRVRAVTFIAMLGSAGYSVLLDERYPLAFHVTMLLLCLLGMALGSILRVRLYLVLGSAGIVADLAVILARALIEMDRGPRMMAVGFLVLLLGTGLVAGAILYKTQRETLGGHIDRLRLLLEAWE
jgi:hypothetical protein